MPLSLKGVSAALSVALGSTWYLSIPSEGSTLRFPLVEETRRTIRTVRVVSLCYIDYKLTGWWNNYEETWRHGWQERTGHRIFHLCDRQGGLYIKGGQHLASLTHVLPARMTAPLKKLEDKCAPRSEESVRRVLTHDIGNVDNYFHSLEAEPIAAGSLAQVHRATLAKEGHPLVAVKVQHEFLKEQIYFDLKLLNYLCDLSYWAMPDFQMHWILPVFEKNILEETDFVREASNMARVRSFFQEKDNRVHIPEVEACSPRVLIMEFINGVRLEEYVKKYPQSAPGIASALLSFFGRMIFSLGFIHADPHGGNLCIRQLENKDKDKNSVSVSSSDPEWQLVILDHGLYAELKEKERLAYASCWYGMLRGDTSAVAGAMGVLNPDSAQDNLAVAGLSATKDVRFIMDMLSAEAWQQERMEYGQKPLTDEDRKARRKRHQHRFPDVMLFVSTLPPALLLVLKVNNLLRSMLVRLQVTSSAVSRYLVMGQYAFGALHPRLEMWLPSILLNVVYKGSLLAHVVALYLRSVVHLA